MHLCKCAQIDVIALQSIRGGLQSPLLLSGSATLVVRHAMTCISADQAVVREPALVTACAPNLPVEFAARALALDL